MSVTAIRQIVTTLNEVQRCFGLQRSPDAEFFREWQGELPPLSADDRHSLDLVRQRFRYHRDSGQVRENAVNAIVVSRLMELAGFYDPPFQIRSEVSVSITAQETEQPLRGRLDFLVVKDQLWHVIIESKETEFDLEVGIPQLLAYMMAVPKPQSPLFGLVTNGNSFIFVKVDPGVSLSYDFSDTFSLLSRSNCLYRVLGILRHLAHLIQPTGVGIVGE